MFVCLFVLIINWKEVKVMAQVFKVADLMFRARIRFSDSGHSLVSLTEEGQANGG